MIIEKLLGALVNFGFGGLVSRTFDYMERRAELQNDKDRIKAEVTIEAARQAVNEVRIMADLNKAKFAHWQFWFMASLFVVPLAVWWAAVIADSVFGFTWNVADLPTLQMQEWAGSMIKWLFYTGTTVAAVKAMAGR